MTLVTVKGIGKYVINNLHSFRAFMRQKGCNISRWACSSVPHPLQKDGTSCGVFALKVSMVYSSVSI